MTDWEPKAGDWVTVVGRVSHWKVEHYDPDTNRGELMPETFSLRIPLSRNRNGEWTGFPGETVTHHPDYVPTKGSEAKAARLDALVSAMQTQFAKALQTQETDYSWSILAEVLFFAATGQLWHEDIQAYNEFEHGLRNQLTP